MYPMLKRWIRLPTPVTTRSITTESWSTWKAKSICSAPAANQCQSDTWIGASGGWARSWPVTARATRKAASSTPAPMTETARLASGRRMARAPLTRKPASGSATVSQTQRTAPSAGSAGGASRAAWRTASSEWLISPAAG